GKVIARLTHPEGQRLSAFQFNHDGSKLIGLMDGNAGWSAWDLRRIGKGLKELGLEWDVTLFPPEQSQSEDPLKVKIVGVELLDANIRKPLESFLQSLALVNPVSADDYYTRGMNSSRQEWYDFALRDYDMSLKLDPTYTKARSARANEYFRREKWAAAVADYEAVIQANNRSAPARFRRACALTELGRFADANRAYSELIDADWIQSVDLYGLHALRADVRQRLGDQAGAAEDRKRALTPIIPKNDAVAPSTLRPGMQINNFAWKLLTNTPETRVNRTALILIRLVVTTEQSVEALHLNTLGVAEYRNGLYREAIVTLQKSLKLGKGQSDGFDLYFLAMAHAQLKDAAAAKYCFDRAVVWTQAQAKLSNNHKMELRMFHDEAAQLLKRKN
ncbi:MAG: tetratricopeptide repeat protein, partial [Gemmataceae bacterium]